jgi:hypothetical protein
MMSVIVLETCWGDNVIYILQNKKLGASSWSQKIDYYFMFNMETEANSSRNFKTRVHTGNKSKGNWICENSEFCLLN